MKLTMKIDFEKIPLDVNNRMFRPIAVGKNEGRWFIRTDLWFVGYRLTRGV